MPTPSRPARAKSKRASEEQIEGVTLTHPERVLFTDVNVTKADLARYYTAVADWILPEITHRPLSLVRCPDGAGGHCFFQKHWKEGLPPAIQSIEIEEQAGADQYVQIENLPGLISLVQISVLEIHPWGARSDRLEHPDRVVIDLDPGPGVPWKAVIDAAREVRRLLDQWDLVSFVRTSGGKGLHVVLPLARRNSWPDVESFAANIARGLARHAGDRFVANMRKDLRDGRIYVDYLRNQRGSTAIASYSTRNRPGCPVAAPVSWTELGRIDSPARFTTANVPRRLAKLKRDPWDGITKAKQSLTKDLLQNVEAFANRPT